MERDLIEEINARTKFPITKQDSYGHAIYHGAKKIKNVKKQGKKKLLYNLDCVSEENCVQFS